MITYHPALSDALHNTSELQLTQLMRRIGDGTGEGPGELRDAKFFLFLSELGEEQKELQPQRVLKQGQTPGQCGDRFILSYHI